MKIIDNLNGNGDYYIGEEPEDSDSQAGEEEEEFFDEEEEGDEESEGDTIKPKTEESKKNKNEDFESKVSTACTNDVLQMQTGGPNQSQGDSKR